ncbi:mersacidin/lichenicidin family type 2 lantibiotic [Nocardiopsis sp. MG754419]|uniref:mersacidin/lichenicidin family type 2 lantibiotic n=1 Tax=Nocardiopsis sp. MG754419 TaxID=2259865 RepID=UPI001BA9FC60|nr:mersacidin/lichenicidin family type 2 lantibiotic [Nocardiopsis sp. MG754419]MBR8741849.1 mersacidin/lichenicidin family type 2 lantibiotic [Nocardiopsis sp. MG754419]
MDIAKAWKNPLYRASLSEKQRDSLPEHPAGGIVVSDEEMDSVNGGTTVPCSAVTAAVCNTFTDTVCHGSCGSWSVGCC